MSPVRVLTLASLLVGTCSSLNIVETAQATSDVSILVEAVVKANLASTLSGTGPFTVFAPTNAAFTDALAALKIDKDALLARPDLADILKYHVLPSKIMAADLQASQFPATVQGLKVLVQKTHGGSGGGAPTVTFGGAKVTTADVACDNGVIHIIDKVVLPPSLNVVQTAQATPDFSVLVEAVVRANLATTLSEPTKSFTVFAPTNAAFTAALTALKIDKAALLARSDLADILKYHVVPGKIMAADLQASQTPATLQGLKVMVEKSSTGVAFGGAKVTTADIPCTNGVIHIIDAVVLPPSMNIVQTAQATPDFSVLVEAVVKANLATALSAPGPFTVFAPTNAAFTAALTALKIDKAALLARSDLADILKYHVVPGKIMAADLQASQAPATLQGLKVMVDKSSTGVTFGGAKVTTADIACANGVIHVIDAVVLPPSMNVVQTAQATSDFSVLVEAVVKANLATTLSGVGPFTVFAPTNAAFTAALTALNITKTQLLARNDLADILKYHVISGKIMAADLKASQTPATLEGKTVAVLKDGSGVTFGGAKVTGADIACSNGVIHQIDKVVLPPAATTTGGPGPSGVSVPSGASSRIAAASVLSGVAMMIFA